MNLLKEYKALPKSSKRLMSMSIIIALVLALPLFIWAIVNLNFNPFERASSNEPGVCIAQNKTITVTPVTDLNGTCHDIQTAVNAVTGAGFTIQIDPGTYNVPPTVNVSGKTNLTITGNPSAGNGAAVLNFTIGGYGFRVDNSSGSIQWLTVQGGSSNGMISINNSSNFSLGYMNVNSQTSHTVDIHNSHDVSVYNTEIQSSAGALEVGNSQNINIANNKIHDAANAISVYNSSGVQVIGNLIYQNRETGITSSDNSNIQISRNTFVRNGSNSGYPTVYLRGNQATSNEFSYNIVNQGYGPGVRGENGLVFSTFVYNDIFGNNPNYYSYANQTGLNNNISQDPQLNPTNNIYCPYSTSPVIFGNVANFGYMGYIGPCGGTPPPSGSPSPTPNGTPPPTACTARPLELTVTPANQKGNPGTTARYYLSVKNNDDVNCGTPTVNLQVGSVNWPDGNSTANGWTVNFGAGSFNVAPGATYTSYIDVTSPTSSYALGNHSINITATTPNVPQNTSGTNFVYNLTNDQLSQSFDIRVRYAGVTGGDAEGAKANIRFVSVPVADLSTGPVEFHHIGSGVYEAIITPDYLPPSAGGQGYAVYVKGEKHLARKFCQATGQSSECSGNGSIVIPAPSTNPAPFVLDFTGLPLEPGDLYVQDGKADASDFAKVTALMSKASSLLTDEDLMVGDLNYDTYVNIKDAFLMRQTLQTKYDEN